MKLRKIEVKNYRLLKEFSLDLEENLSLIIGKNNCGKTSLLSVLDKFIGEKAKTNNFTYDDFNIAFQEKFMRGVKNENSFEDNQFPLGISLRLFITYEDKDDLSNISTVMMNLQPDNNYIVLGFDYAIAMDDFQRLKDHYKKYSEERKRKDEIKAKKTIAIKKEEIETYLANAEINYYADFIKEEYKKYFSLTRKSIDYDMARKCQIEKNFEDLDKNKIDLNRIINFQYINAKRDVANSDKDNSLSILSSKYYEKTELNNEQQESIQKFKDIIVDTDKELDEIYLSLFENVIKKVSKFGGITKNESLLKIISSLKHKQLLSGNTKVMYQHSDNNLLPENYNGLGYMNLIGMIFEIEVMLNQFSRSSLDVKPADINLFFIEEPEAHTHPQMQYVFIKNIKNLLNEGRIDKDGKIIFDMQTIITTHSSHIVSESEFDDLKYFYKNSEGNVYAKNIKELSNKFKPDEIKNYKFLKQYLTLNRAELFFADKAIFIEGDTERILLPAMMKKIDLTSTEGGIPLLSQNISIIEVGAHSHIFEKFIGFLGIKSLIITDLDSAKIVPNSEGKKNKKGKIINKIMICKVSDTQASISTNAALKYFYSVNVNKSEESLEEESLEKDNEENLDEQEDNKAFESKLDKFLDKNLSKKTFSKNADDIWVADNLGNLAVIYQTLETVEEENYYPRSFEDAFIYLNRKFIIDNIKFFESLKNKGYFKRTDKDAFDLANECVHKKPAFAIEILLNSKQDFSNWEIPNYIAEGLKWLKKS